MEHVSLVKIPLLFVWLPWRPIRTNILPTPMYMHSQALQFEHRDMHRGNILVRRTHQETVYFRLDHKDYYIKTHGVLATIVDYTLSRIKQGTIRKC